MIQWVDRSMMELTTAQIEYLASQRLGRLATAGGDGKPHVVPTSFRYNRELGTLEVGGHGVATTKNTETSRRTPGQRSSLTTWCQSTPGGPACLRFAGRAEAVGSGGADLGPGYGDAFIRIYPEKVNSFGIE